MKHRIIIFLFTVIYFFCFTGCKSNQKIVYDKHGESIQYNGTEYVVFENTNGFLCYNADGLKKVGSCWYIPFLAKTYFYSDTIESPTFICSSRTDTLWFKKDFIVLDEEFIISDTDSSISFSNIFFENNSINIEEDKINDFKCYLKSHKNIYVNISLFKYEDKYYVKFAWDKPCYEITEQFYDLLIINKLL